MFKNPLTLTVAAAVLTFSSISCPASQFLLNGNFESPAQTTLGDHANTLPDTWIVGESINATMSIAGDSNIERGTVTDGTGVTDHSKDLPICPDDPTGLQSLDGINKDVYVLQSFTLSSAFVLNISIDFGGRDANSGSGAGSAWELLNPGGTVVASASGLAPATGSWLKSSATTSLLPAGAYKFVVYLSDPDIVDAASVTNVPEPTTLTAAGLGIGLLCWVSFRRRRRS